MNIYRVIFFFFLVCLQLATSWKINGNLKTKGEMLLKIFNNDVSDFGALYPA